MPDTPEGCPPAADVAAAIEDCIFEEFASTNMKYKTRIRSRYANLKDAKNPNLRTNVMTGAIEPEKIAKMTAEVSLYLLLNFECDLAYKHILYFD